MADKRVAFVVGNSNYQTVVALANPANDADAIANLFRKAAFDVVESRRDLKNTD
ncbi:caspase family protein, partial [Acinetobacter baumannii]|uniref:caspase family protein n=3 Tax=Pseudomonadota TaxID=1224 RepID=UPI001BB46B4E